MNMRQAESTAKTAGKDTGFARIFRDRGGFPLAHFRRGATGAKDAAAIDDAGDSVHSFFVTPSFDPLAEKFEPETLSPHLVRRNARAVAGLFLLGIAWGDYRTGPDLSFISLYLIPVFVAVWFIRLRDALGVALIGAAVWPTLALLGVVSDAPLRILLWNAANRLIVLAAFACLAAHVKSRR